MVARIRRGVLAFGVLGLIWAAELGLFLRVGCFEHDDPLGFSLPVTVPLASAFVGGVAAALATKPGANRWATVVVLVPMVGMVCGLVTALVWWPAAVGIGLSNGLLFGVAALALVLPLFAAMRGLSRENSLTDIAERLSVWAVLGAIGAITSLLTLPRWKSYPMCHGEAAQAMFAPFASVAIAAFAASAAIVHILGARRAIACPPSYLDLGVGDARHEIKTHPATAYRHVSETLSVVHGDLARARHILRSRTIVAVMALLVALVSGSAALVLLAK